MSIIALGVLAAFLVDRQLPSPLISKAHALSESSDPKTGCASCHTKPIVADCASCHAQPPTTIGDINFPHHADQAPKNCQSGNCHNGDNDARYVKDLEASHDYCDQCHEYKHSSPD